jgi:hypothetical protein
MRYFGNTEFDLRSVPQAMKLIITGFLGFMLAGYFLNLVMTISTIGLTYGSIVSYYLGSKTELAFPKTYRYLLEVSHFHLFIMPLILLTVSHLFLFTSWPARRQTPFIVAAFVAMGGQVLLPWLIRYGHRSFALLKTPTDIVMTVSFVTMAGLPLLEMWRPNKQLHKTGGR